MPDKQIPLPASGFPLQEPEGPDGMPEMLKRRMAANMLPDLTVLGTSSKQPLATVPHLPSQRHFRYVTESPPFLALK